MSYDLLIKNGTVVDGTGAPRRRADVAVKDGLVAEIGKVTEGAAKVIDADGLIAGRQLPGFAAHHEAGVPVPDAVAVDAHTAGLGGQLSRPHDRDGQATGQTQPAIVECKSAFGCSSGLAGRVWRT